MKRMIVLALALALAAGARADLGRLDFMIGEWRGTSSTAKDS